MLVPATTHAAIDAVAGRSWPHGAPSAPSFKAFICAFAFSKAALYSLAPSELPNLIAKIVSSSSPDEKSHADQTQDLSEPTFGSNSMRGSTTWLQMILALIVSRQGC